MWISHKRWERDTFECYECAILRKVPAVSRQSDLAYLPQIPVPLISPFRCYDDLVHIGLSHSSFGFVGSYALPAHPPRAWLLPPPPRWHHFSIDHTLTIIPEVLWAGLLYLGIPHCLLVFVNSIFIKNPGPTPKSRFAPCIDLTHASAFISPDHTYLPPLQSSLHLLHIIKIISTLVLSCLLPLFYSISWLT